MAGREGAHAEQDDGGHGEHDDQEGRRQRAYAVARCLGPSPVSAPRPPPKSAGGPERIPPYWPRRRPQHVSRPISMTTRAAAQGPDADDQVAKSSGADDMPISQADDADRGAGGRVALSGLSARMPVLGGSSFMV